MPAFFVVPIVLSAIVGLYSDGTELTERQAWLFTKFQELQEPQTLEVPLPTPEAPNTSLIVAPPSPQDSLPPSAVPTDYQYNHDEIQSLKRQLIDLTQKRAERMTADELKRSIADTRRQFLIAELKAFANESPDKLDSLRAGIAAAALLAKDRNELATTIGSLSSELEQGVDTH